MQVAIYLRKVKSLKESETRFKKPRIRLAPAGGGGRKEASVNAWSKKVQGVYKDKKSFTPGNDTGKTDKEKKKGNKNL